MRTLLTLVAVLVLAAPAIADGLDPELKSPYQLRIVVRTGDHPTLTRHFRAEVMKEVGSALQAALGPVATVEVVGLNDTPLEKQEPLWRLVDEKGLEALDNVNTGGGGKTHFVFVDFADGKYEIRARQHDGTCGFCTPIVRKTVHGDRGFVGRLAGLAIAQDFGAVGTFDPNGQQVTVVLKAGELGPMDAWVKKGDVFAVVQIKPGRRALPKTPGKGKTKEKVEPATPAIMGQRLDGVLLQVIDGPRNGLCVCKLYNRYQRLPAREGSFGYRAVKLGTGEGKLKLQITDANGNPYRNDILQPRVGVNDFPDATPRDREEMRYSDGVFTSQETLKNIGFVVVRAGDTVAARIPIEIYPERVAVRRVNMNPNSEPNPIVAAAADMLDRVRSLRVMQARSFEEIATLQNKERQKALDFGQAVYDSLTKEANALRADLNRLRERYKAEAPAGIFDPAETDVKALEAKTRELREHLAKLKDVIRIENDPTAAANRKAIEGLLLEAKLLAQKADLDQAIAKYEEALKLTATEPAAKVEIEKALEELRKLWEVKSPEHANARKYIYETWANLAQPQEVREALAPARRAFETCKSAGDRISLMKMYLVGPQVLERFAENLRTLVDEAVDDEDRKKLAAYERTREDLEKLLNDVGKEIGADAAK
jgi:hypothetical protein